MSEQEQGPAQPAELLSHGFRPVYDFALGGFTPGFEHDAEYQFARAYDGLLGRFRLADRSPFYNIAGLYWLPQPPEQAA